MPWTPGEQVDIGGMPAAAEWEQLSVVPVKRELLGADLYFREGWADVVEVFGADAMDALHGLAMLVVKPDAVVGRRLGVILDYLLQHGFTPVATTSLAFTRHSMREVWRYDWHVYTIDRLRLCSFWYVTNDVLLFLARDTRPVAGLPATVRLSELKGLGDPAKRGPHHLRTALRPPNRILNFVHVGDEPADVVRELAIFLDAAERGRFLRQLRADIRSDRTDQARAAITDIESRYPAHDLDIEAVLVRLAPFVAQQALRHLREVVNGAEKIGWDELTEAVPVARVDRWDVIVLASYVVRNERPVPHALLPSVTAADWVTRAAGQPS
ncbi:nucleoside-diphosphate kinase [Actinokineospora globicatena]|uniref:nucleoside-diphosphate kinase n=1 Tax=Actinokineospora globicatena TaxID=103729 RepID=UPI0020A386C9|nr:nucleoside-diphosphate kinase [Actinokineospora globicatena]MCP2303928.1 Nucleoside diphosphate kinase [Actinokineospora globicatena]GLW78912.1 hypothetical protein Aglo01_33940 [Actinokineospora globicatena]GLW86676.1 hypothetical protein Aglo02_43150 [Actinokineospora globicatena]